jgi:hypothetical protein
MHRRVPVAGRAISVIFVAAIRCMSFITGRTAINALNSGTVADAVLSFSHGASLWRIKFRLPQSMEPTTQYVDVPYWAPRSRFSL